MSDGKTDPLSKANPMKPKDWFGVGIRLFGVWMLLDAMTEMIGFANTELGYTKYTTVTPAAYLVHSVVDFVVGLFLLSGAKLLISFAGEWGPEHATGLCPTCGYDLRATPDRCPECGTVPAKI